MFTTSTGFLGSLEQSMMECFWANGPQTSGQILKTLRQNRAIAHTTVTTTLARLYEHGLVLREPIAGCGGKQSWRYTARYATRGALLAAAVEQLCAQIGAESADRFTALKVLVGETR
jgi:predicted transcriptional regulator